jgi:putative heme iron utilization protein
MSEASVFTPEVIAAIGRQMNDDHADDVLLICRTLGGQPAATGARMTGLDVDGIEFDAAVDGIAVPVRVPFRHRLTEHAQVRGEVVRMYREACQLLGIEPGGAG